MHFLQTYARIVSRIMNIKKFFGDIVLATRIITLQRRYVWIWFFSALGFFALLILIPVWTTPGNDILFQLRILGPVFDSVLILLAIVNGLLVAMQWYGLAHTKKADTYVLGGSMVGMFIGFFVSLFACAACYSTLLAFVGFGVATFFVQYRVAFIIFTFAILFWALLKNAQRILGHCDSCQLTR